MPDQKAQNHTGFVPQVAKDLICSAFARPVSGIRQSKQGSCLGFAHAALDQGFYRLGIGFIYAFLFANFFAALFANFPNHFAAL